jgi:hypothetical protein
MENHPIPQQISSYQFRLVGDMTLKQFFQVGGGALIAILLYSSGLPVYIKWPLLVISFLLGVALAFFPLEDRPLSKWLFLFMKSVYAPTLYIWMANTQKPQYFQPEGANTPVVTPQPLVELPPVAAPGTPISLDKNEEQFLSKVDTLDTSPSQTPSLQIPEPTQTQEGFVVKQEELPSENQEEETKQPLTVPEAPTIALEKHEETQPLPEKAQPLDVGTDINPMSGTTVLNTNAAQFSLDASPPMPPTRENVIVGQVMDNTGKIVENAILEVKDAEGRAARALRSNKLGHFMTVTPLSNGTYTIETDKEGLVFDPITLDANGTIIPPIAIRAKHE